MHPSADHNNKPKADPSRMVKSFSRSAAGAKLNNARNLRPAPVLRQTVAYLLHEYVVGVSEGFVCNVSISVSLPFLTYHGMWCTILSWTD